MLAAWCFQCQLHYAEDVAECLECGVPTVSHAPTDPATFATAAETRIAYELHGWNGSARAAVENRLYAAAISHAWEGPTLMVYERDEIGVDELIDEIDAALDTAAASGTDAPDGRVGFDLGARNEQLHELVTAKLAAAGIEHELTGNGFLLVSSVHEDLVADWIEGVQADLRDTSAFGDGVEGVDAHEIVAAMFLSADSLRRNTRDLRAQRRLLDAEATARDLKLPFGYEAPMWRNVLHQAAILSALIEDAAEDNLVEVEATNLRNLLHPYV